MSPDQLVDVLLAILGTLIVGIMGWFVLEFRTMRLSVEKLNLTMIEVVGQLQHHHSRIEKLENHLEL